MIVDSLTIDPTAFADHTRWVAKPEGMCKDDLCVPVPPNARTDVGHLDLEVIAPRLAMPLIHDESAEIWALGPEGGGRALTSAEAADPTLPDFDGNSFRLSSLHGRKVLLLAWASW